MRQCGSHFVACRPSCRVMRPTQSMPAKETDQNRGLTDIKREYRTIHDQREAVSSVHSRMSRPEAPTSACPRPPSRRLLQDPGQDCWDWKQGLDRPNADPFRRQGPAHLHEMPGGGRIVREDQPCNRVQGIHAKTAQSSRKECQVFDTTTNSMGTGLATTHHGQRATIRLMSCAGTVALLTALFSGCASEPADWETGPRFTEVTRARELAFHYREQALTLSRLADTVAWEAREDALHNSDSSEFSRRLSHIQNLRIQAESAFERAREYRSQVPHNQVY